MIGIEALSAISTTRNLQERSTLFQLPPDVVLRVFEISLFGFTCLRESIDTYLALTLSCRRSFDLLEAESPQHQSARTRFLTLISHILETDGVSKGEIQSVSNAKLPAPFLFHQTHRHLNNLFYRQYVSRKNPEIYQPLIEWVQELHEQEQKAISYLEVSLILGNKKEVLRMIKSLPHVASLNIDDIQAGAKSNEWQLDDETLETIAKSCKNLRRLSLESKWFSQKGFNQMLKIHRQSLVSLDLSRCPQLDLTFFQDPSALIDTLTHLRLPSHADQSCVERALSQFPGVHSLDLHFNKSLTTGDIEHLIAHNPQLTNLRLKHSKLGEKGVEFLRITFPTLNFEN